MVNDTRSFFGDTFCTCQKERGKKANDSSQTVLQTTIDYNNDRIGGIQSTEVEGTYLTRKQAFEAAHVALLDNEVTKESFAEYDEKEDFPGEWPYGDECFVHAVGPTGQNFMIYVKAQPHLHQRHACTHHGGKKCECSCNHKEGGCKHKQCKHEDCSCSKKASKDEL